MRYPALLKTGNTIGICAPSAGVPAQFTARLDQAIRNIEALGYRCLESKSLRGNAKCVSADAQIRAKEFMALYKDSDVSAIIPPWGGEFLMDMLPYLDFDLLCSLPPKWVCGYSDITTLTFVLTLLCDMATIHGSNLMNMGYRIVDEHDLLAFAAMSDTSITQYSSKEWGHFTSWEDISAKPYTYTDITKWESLQAEESMQFAGRMIGGCLDVLCKLLGSRFAPVGAFLDKYREDGFIWTLESCEMNSADIYRTLWQMRECGWFQYCRGFLIGRPDGYSDVHDFTLMDALQSALDSLHVPVIFQADIGHIPPQMQIINGAYGEILYQNGKATIVQYQKSVHAES